MIISHKYKFIFIANGKSGSSSIENILKKYGDKFPLSDEEYDLYNKHIPAIFLKPKLNEEVWNTYFKVSFVRNTWDWVISQFFFNLYDKGHNTLHVKQFNKLSIENILQTYEHIKIFKRGIYWRDGYFQKDRVCDKNGQIMIDFVGRFENIQNDFNTICDKIGIPKSELPFLNKSYHTQYKQYYTPDTIKLVGELWKEDIEKFNFKY